MHPTRAFIFAATALAASVVPAQAQLRVSAPVSESTTSDSRELINNKDWHFIGRVEMERAGDTKIFADEVRWSSDTNRAVATGNVVFQQANNRISAERAEFDTETRLGTFYNAFGNASITPPRPAAPTAGIAVPTVLGQETDVYFYGDTIEKLGPKKYRITNGGFTTCVQPTPRWLLSSKTVVLNIDAYTMMRQTVFSVKGVPMLYTPILYYPTKREERATGVLIPTYGTSTLRGSSIHNAFFWALNRSQDLTFMHDWYTSAGQGIGGEYRYNFGGGTDGGFKSYWLDQGERTITYDTGQSQLFPAEQSYEIRGGANQVLPHGFHARTRIDYFSSLQTSQTFNTGIYDISRNTRSFGGNVVGLSNGFSLNGTFDHSEYFYPGSSAVIGAFPRVSVARNERPLAGSQVYYSVGTEYVSILHSTTSGTPGSATAVVLDSGLTRFDVNPQIRYPFKKWQFFTANSTVTWRNTYYTRSWDPKTHVLLDEGLNRTFFTFQSQLLGPVFNRVFNTPDKKYAEKFKHSIEPYLNLSRTTSIDNFDKIIQLEGIDYILGNSTQYTYGIANRFYAKRRPPPGSASLVGISSEIITVDFQQSYYTDANAAKYDLQYATNNPGSPTPPTHFSPLRLSVRVMPTNEFNATATTEWDSRYLGLRTVSASGSYTLINMVQATGSWSKRGYIPQLPGWDNPALLDQSLNASTNVHTRDNKYGGQYSFTYDVLRSSLIQQRLTGFYNAQCCGLAFEYQTYNLGSFTGLLTSLASPVDRRFFMSFTLAGLGNFSPFNGAMGGIPR